MNQTGDVTYSQVFGSIGGWLGGLLFGLIILFIIGFSIWMLVDSILRKQTNYPENQKKFLWIIFLLIAPLLLVVYIPFISFVPSMVYYYIVKRKLKTDKKVKL